MHLDIAVDETKEVPTSQGFWMDLGDGNEDNFFRYSGRRRD